MDLPKNTKSAMENSSVKLGKCRHYKDKKYEFIGVARHSETLEELVIYRESYGDFGLRTNPLGIFLENDTDRKKSAAISVFS